MAVFWNEYISDHTWLEQVTEGLNSDGIEVVNHHFDEPTTSQFSLNTLPHIAPHLIVQKIKGRLKYAVRSQASDPFKRNFALRSVGQVTREVTESYVRSQLDHHRVADPRFHAKLEEIQMYFPDIHLEFPQKTSHGLYWYNLHIVIVNQDRWRETRIDKLEMRRSISIRTAGKWELKLSAGGVLPEHTHLLLGGSFELSPAEIALNFMNNYAYAYGMQAVCQHGDFIGTVGEYTKGAMKTRGQMH